MTKHLKTIGVVAAVAIMGTISMGVAFAGMLQPATVKSTGPLEIKILSPSSGTIATNFISTTTPNNEILCLSGTNNGQSTFNAPTDTSDLTWTLIKHVTGNNHAISGYYAYSNNILTGDVVTTSITGSASLETACFAVSGSSSDNPIDSESIASSGGNGESLSVTIPASVYNSELIVGMFTVSSTPAMTQANGYSLVTTTKTAPDVSVEDEQFSAAQTDISVGMQLSTSESWSGLAFGISLGTLSSTTVSTSSISTSSTISTSTTSSPSASSFSSSTTATTLSSTVSLTVSSESVNNACFTHSFDSANSPIDAIYYECSATLNPGQAISQYVLRSSQLYGTFTISVNASQSVELMVVQNGSLIFSAAGTSITYSSSAPQGELMSVQVTNSEFSATSYELGIDWQSV